jgi:hypothetical protein
MSQIDFGSLGGFDLAVWLPTSPMMIYNERVQYFNSFAEKYKHYADFTDEFEMQRFTAVFLTIRYYEVLLTQTIL